MYCQIYCNRSLLYCGRTKTREVTSCSRAGLPSCFFFSPTNEMPASQDMKMAALCSEFGDLVKIKKQLISVISLCKERGLLHSAKW